MSFFRRIFGATKRLGREPFGDGFLLKDEAGDWVSWVNGSGKKLRNLREAQVKVLGGGVVAIREADAEGFVLWNAEGTCIVDEPHAGFNAMIPGRLISANMLDYRRQVYLWDGTPGLPHPVSTVSRTGSKDTVIISNQGQPGCGLVQLPTDALPPLKWWDLKEVAPDHFVGWAAQGSSKCWLLQPNGQPLLEMELDSVAPPTWQVKEAWKSDPNTEGEVVVSFRPLGMEPGMAVARSTTGEMRTYRAGAETVLIPWPEPAE